MESSAAALGAMLRRELVYADGVTKFSPNRRFATIYAEASSADSIFFVDSGLVKLYKRGKDSKEIILQIVPPDDLFGEQILAGETVHTIAAEVLQEGVIYSIPRGVFVRFCDDHPAAWRYVTELLARRKRQLEKKIELLCLQDVEYRILYYLADLATELGHRNGQEEYLLPLSQGELASVIGATRETTSTMLNALARKGLLRLGRRQLTVPSIDGLRNATNDRPTRSKSAGN